MAPSIRRSKTLIESLILDAGTRATRRGLGVRDDNKHTINRNRDKFQKAVPYLSYQGPMF